MGNMTVETMVTMMKVVESEQPLVSGMETWLVWMSLEMELD